MLGRQLDGWKQWTETMVFRASSRWSQLTQTGSVAYRAAPYAGRERGTLFAVLPLDGASSRRALFEEPLLADVGRQRDNKHRLHDRSVEETSKRGPLPSGAVSRGSPRKGRIVCSTHGEHCLHCRSIDGAIQQESLFTGPPPRGSQNMGVVTLARASPLSSSLQPRTFARASPLSSSRRPIK